MTCGARLAVKTVLSGVATLLLLIATPSRVFSGTFTDVTGSAGLHGTGFTFGNPIWGDFDGDRYIDCFLDNHYQRGSYLYRNNSDGTFTDIRPISGLTPAGDRHGSAWADFDNDDDLDLFITKGARRGHSLGSKKDQFYENLGGAQFRDIAEAAGVTNTFGRGRSVAWGDYDNDGYLDLLLGNTQTDLVLYKNHRDGTFIDKTVQAGLGNLQYTECAFADYNNDRLTDIFCVVSGTHPLRDILLKNNGDGTFTNVSGEAGILDLNNGRAIAWGDYDNDGDLDLFISRGSHTQHNDEALRQTLYRNNGNGTFTEVTDQAGLGELSNNRAAAWGDYNRAAAWGDYNNDGYLDLYVVNSGNDTDGK
jgi:hypothetical protein